MPAGELDITQIMDLMAGWLPQAPETRSGSSPYSANNPLAIDVPRLYDQEGELSRQLLSDEHGNTPRSKWEFCHNL